jgi:ABC-type multidrug transport system fused ATPase/permease subunit
MQSADAGDKRIQELECEQEEERFSSWQNESLPMSPQIQFQNVSFTYPSAKAEVIHDITFTAPAGRRTAIVGASGGGKTTCLGMLEKYYSPQKGRVTIAGKDIRMIPDDVLHAAIGYIDQSSVTLTGSIRDNLDPKQSGYADTSMRDALIQVGLDSIGGSAQRDILDSPIGESGVALSGGQRQRLSLARAILHHPKVLVMDEPTASLDGIAESQINELIDRTMKGVTTVYSAHRLSLILAADWIVVIRDGKMLREGTHEDLMCSCPYYASLIAAQQGRKTV